MSCNICIKTLNRISRTLKCAHIYLNISKLSKFDYYVITILSGRKLYY